MEYIGAIPQNKEYFEIYKSGKVSFNSCFTFTEKQTFSLTGGELSRAAFQKNNLIIYSMNNIILWAIPDNWCYSTHYYPKEKGDLEPILYWN